MAQTIGGVDNAINQNHGIDTGNSLPENGLGRAIGSEISLAQGVGQMIGGSTMASGELQKHLVLPQQQQGERGQLFRPAGVVTALWLLEAQD